MRGSGLNGNTTGCSVLSEREYLTYHTESGEDDSGPGLPGSASGNDPACFADRRDPDLCFGTPDAFVQYVWDMCRLGRQ